MGSAVRRPGHRPGESERPDGGPAGARRQRRAGVERRDRQLLPAGAGGHVRCGDRRARGVSGLPEHQRDRPSRRVGHPRHRPRARQLGRHLHARRRHAEHPRARPRRRRARRREQRRAHLGTRPDAVPPAPRAGQHARGLRPEHPGAQVGLDRAGRAGPGRHRGGGRARVPGRQCHQRPGRGAAGGGAGHDRRTRPHLDTLAAHASHPRSVGDALRAGPHATGHRRPAPLPEWRLRTRGWQRSRGRGGHYHGQRRARRMGSVAAAGEPARVLGRRTADVAPDWHQPRDPALRGGDRPHHGAGHAVGPKRPGAHAAAPAHAHLGACGRRPPRVFRECHQWPGAAGGSGDWRRRPDLARRGVAHRRRSRYRHDDGRGRRCGLHGRTVRCGVGHHRGPHAPTRLGGRGRGRHAQRVGACSRQLRTRHARAFAARAWSRDLSGRRLHVRRLAVQARLRGGRSDERRAHAARDVRARRHPHLRPGHRRRADLRGGRDVWGAAGRLDQHP